jgi:hypothetical protein
MLKLLYVLIIKKPLSKYYYFIALNFVKLPVIPKAGDRKGGSEDIFIFKNKMLSISAQGCEKTPIG